MWLAIGCGETVYQPINSKDGNTALSTESSKKVMGCGVSGWNKIQRMGAALTLFTPHLEECMIDQWFLVFTLFCSKLKGVHDFDFTTVLCAQEPTNDWTDPM